MNENLQREIDANFEVFQKMLPELQRREADRWALMRHGECVDFYDTLRDAQTAGHALYEDGIFSVQQVSTDIVDLGRFSRAAY